MLYLNAGHEYEVWYGCYSKQILRVRVAQKEMPLDGAFVLKPLKRPRPGTATPRGRQVRQRPRR
jgi:hypothetical protein